MKNLLSFLFSSIFLLTGMPGLAADNSETRFCNFQGREIALRISEEVSNELTAAERSRIAAIAEEVCQDFYAESGLSQNSDNRLSDGPVATQAQTNIAENETAAEEGGLLGDLKIIESEDRVRRPGLKRR